LLARDFRVLCYQLRGEDDPFALRRSFGMVDLVEGLDEFLAWHGWSGRLSWACRSAARWPLELAARFPQRLRAADRPGSGAKFERGLLQRVAE
jgi:hypothetical protein